ncbi:MAG: hypothetical protein ACXWW9_09630 [Actinomycetota bacterium]
MIGFRPRLPVEPSGFADAAVRERWIAQRGMTVFSMWDPDDPLRSVDLFVEQPIDFEELWTRSVVVDIDDTPVRVASIADLIRLKHRRPAGGSRGHGSSRGDPGTAAGPMTRSDDRSRVDGWEEHRLAELESSLKATPAQRLRWLEQAIVFAHRAGALPRERSITARPSDPVGGEPEERQ